MHLRRQGIRIVTAIIGHDEAVASRTTGSAYLSRARVPRTPVSGRAEYVSSQMFLPSVDCRLDGSSLGQAR